MLNCAIFLIFDESVKYEKYLVTELRSITLAPSFIIRIRISVMLHRLFLIEFSVFHKKAFEDREFNIQPLQQA